MDEIIEVSRKLFVEKGYDATSMNDICEATNLTKAGLYHYIKSKEDLYNQVDERLFKKHMRTLKEVKKYRSAEEELREFIGRFLDLILSERDLIHFFVERTLARKTTEEVIKDRRRKFISFVKQRLQRIRSKDSDIDITTATFILVGIVNWTSFWFNPEGPISKEDLIEQLSKFFIRGFLAPDDYKKSKSVTCSSP